MIEIHRHEQNNILQGFSFWAYPDPIIILVHEQGVWHSKTKYYGWGSFGAINANVECTGFETMEQADQYITDNNLLFSGEHFFFTDSEVVIFRSNISGESAPVIVADGVIQQTQTADIIFGEPQKVIDWIMQEDFDISGLPTWESLIGTFVKKGRLLQHNNKPWIVTIGHTVQADWEPGSAHSLFVTRYPDGVIGDWVQPTHAENSYFKGARVRHIGHLWESGIDGNTTVPGQNPGHNYWIDLGPIEAEDPGEPDQPEPDLCTTTAEWNGNNATQYQTDFGAGLDVYVKHNNAIWKAKNATHLWIAPDHTGDGAISWEFVKDC